jgi:dTDP-4-dehydrorhamnose reductase
LNKVSRLLLKDGQVLEGAYDSLGSPTSALSLAHAINHMLEHLIKKNNIFNRIFHYSDVGQISRFNFLEEIANQLNKKFHLSNIIKPVSNASFNLHAPRPKDTSLNSDLFEKTFDYKRLEWDTALRNILKKV